MLYRAFFVWLFLTLSLFAQNKVDKLVIAGPIASVSHPLLHMIKTGALADVAEKVEFLLWKDPDELRAILLRGDVDFVAVPTNVAANLYNKGVAIKLLNVSVWGILGILTRDPELKTISDFKGKEIAMPFRGDMPDLVFEVLAKKAGLDPKKDFSLRYVASPVDAMQLLIMRRVDHALLAEPAISIALRKTKSFPLSAIAPDLYRTTMLEDQWGKAFMQEYKIPEAGIAFLGNTAGKEALIKRFLDEYAKSLAWYASHPDEASKLVALKLPMLEATGVADSIGYVKMESRDAHSAKGALDTFFEILRQNEPKVIGGKLPDDAFYYHAQ